MLSVELGDVSWLTQLCQTWYTVTQKKEMIE